MDSDHSQPKRRSGLDASLVDELDTLLGELELLHGLKRMVVPGHRQGGPIQVANQRLGHRRAVADNTSALRVLLRQGIVERTLRRNPDAAVMVGVRIAAVPGLRSELKDGPIGQPALRLVTKVVDARLPEAEMRAWKLYAALRAWSSARSHAEETRRWQKVWRKDDAPEFDHGDNDADIADALWGEQPSVSNLYMVSLAVGRMRPKHARHMAALLPTHRLYRELILEDAAGGALNHLDMTLARVAGDRSRFEGPDDFAIGLS